MGTDERSRLVAVLGLGGIGKTLLAARVARDCASSFERVFWRSLRDAPSLSEWLTDAIGFLAPDDGTQPSGEPGSTPATNGLLRDARCLLVLDNFETVLQSGGRAGTYRPGYERYGLLLRQLAEAAHQSCLFVTSREEPLELGPLRGEDGPVRTLVLEGLPVVEGHALLRDKWLEGSENDWHLLIGHCGGNGLVLKVVAETIRDLFGGSIADFLTYAGSTSTVIVGGVRQLLSQQIQRLSDLEQDLLRLMAVEREPVSILELVADLGPRTGRGETLDALEGLRRRSLLERTQAGPLFGLHSVVLEYVTDKLVDDLANELDSGELRLLTRLPLIKATAKDYVRRAQERLIGTPLLRRLDQRGDVRTVAQRLASVLAKLRGLPADAQGYGAGNVVNLLRLMHGDLKGMDLSGLVIRQAYLQR